ncbi:PAS domain-containing protein [Nisaea sp.]|uniref:PAS domain-containing protein n=1 Tax=Nisaea sp. TaxID=2024842 RepID=UPI003B51572E
MTVQEQIIDFSAGDLSSDAQRAMYEYWIEARGRASLPPKTALDPVEFPRDALPLLAVVEPVGDDDFRVRITGTGIRAATGRDLTGTKVSQIEGAHNARERMIKCLENVSAYFVKGSADWAQKPNKYFTALVLPFGTTQHVERILLVFNFSHHAPAAGTQRSGASRLDRS